MNPLKLIYPTQCMLCGRPAEDGLCPACRERAGWERIALRRDPPPQVDAICCALRYEGAARDAMLALKFHQKRSHIAPFARLMAEAWENSGLPQPELLTCVPISSLRTHGRGFNQSEELARALSAHWSIPFTDTLRRRAISRRQSDLEHDRRWDNARRSFVPGRGIDAVRGKSVLLVDDICTTGATLSHCAGLLREAGAKEIRALVACDAGSGRHRNP